jgi:23S rRNA (uracil1939-C5)-methyltransferase
MDADVLLTTLTYGGDAMGRLPDGRAVFVPYALPGERARVRVIEEKRSHARAELVEILQASPQRISPRCPHFMACGGCHYQHLAYPDQLQAKSAILHDQLERIGGITGFPEPAVIASSQEWNYRNYVQFHLTAAGKVGYLAPDSHNIVQIRECHLPETALNSLWPKLDLEPVPGLEQIGLRLGRDDEVMLIFEGSDPQPPEFSVDLPLSAVYSHPQGAAVLAGDDGLVMEVLGRSFQVSAQAFFQVNTHQAGRMVQYLLDHLPLTSSNSLLEVYCGVGLFSAFLAPHVSQLVGIELSPAACQDFAVNLNEFEHVSLYQGAAEAVLPALEVTPDLVVVDPPRAGLERRVLQAILACQPAHLAYVSCDPATLARDLHHFYNAGYRLRELALFDLFPQTYHIESICLLENPR